MREKVREFFENEPFKIARASIEDIAILPSGTVDVPPVFIRFTTVESRERAVNTSFVERNTM